MIAPALLLQMKPKLLTGTSGNNERLWGSESIIAIEYDTSEDSNLTDAIPFPGHIIGTIVKH